jgi:phosphate transport system substrate-binding protein
MTTSRGLRGTIGLSFLWAMTIAAGCSGGGGGAGPAGAGPTPAIVVDGSSTVFRISLAARDAFNQVEPATVVVVDFHGTGAGFNRYLEGEIDIVDASRPAKAAEESKAKERGIDWSRFLVGYDGITLVVNPKNDFVKSMTVEQLKKVWAPSSAVRTWKDVDPSWPDREIIFYSPDHDSGTFEFFTEAIVGTAKKQREDVQISPDDNVLVRGITNDGDSLGYFGYAYYAANKGTLRAVAVQNGPSAAPVLPSPETIIDKTYAPLSRPLFIYVKNSAARRPEVGRFLKYYLDNVDRFAVDGGYAPITPEDKTANQATLAALLPESQNKAENKNAATK